MKDPLFSLEKIDDLPLSVQRFLEKRPSKRTQDVLNVIELFKREPALTIPEVYVGLIRKFDYKKSYRLVQKMLREETWVFKRVKHGVYGLNESKNKQSSTRREDKSVR